MSGLYGYRSIQICKGKCTGTDAYHGDVVRLWEYKRVSGAGAVDIVGYSIMNIPCKWVDGCRALPYISCGHIYP